MSPCPWPSAWPVGGDRLPGRSADAVRRLLRTASSVDDADHPAMKTWRRSSTAPPHGPTRSPRCRSGWRWRVGWPGWFYIDAPSIPGAVRPSARRCATMLRTSTTWTGSTTEHPRRLARLAGHRAVDHRRRPGPDRRPVINGRRLGLAPSAPGPPGADRPPVLVRPGDDPGPFGVLTWRCGRPGRRHPLTARERTMGLAESCHHLGPDRLGALLLAFGDQNSRPGGAGWRSGSVVFLVTLPALAASIRSPSCSSSRRRPGSSASTSTTTSVDGLSMPLRDPAHRLHHRHRWSPMGSHPARVGSTSTWAPS